MSSSVCITGQGAEQLSLDPNYISPVTKSTSSNTAQSINFQIQYLYIMVTDTNGLNLLTDV